jgi:hypothetical protein
MNGYSSKDCCGSRYSTTNRTRAELIKNGVYPEKVRGHARKALQDVEPGFERYRYAAGLTEFVYNSVENVDGGNQSLYRPDYVLDYGVECDCEDQAVLIASLLEVRSFTTRFVGVVNEGFGNHLMVQVRFPEGSLSDLELCADSFYGNGFSGELGYQVGEDGGVWLLCDPVFSPVVGCVNTDFFERDVSGEILFRDETRYDYIVVEQ